MRKPEEQDIQDAKLLYFYPESTDINIKRNLVGLSEGLVTFWDQFSGPKKSEQQHIDDQKNGLPDDFIPGTDPNYQSQEFKAEYKNQTYLVKRIEGNIWLSVLLKLEDIDRMDQNDGFQEFAINNEVNLFRDRVGYQIVEKFYKMWFIFYGKFNDYLQGETLRFSGLFENLFEGYIQRFTTFFADTDNNLPDSTSNGNKYFSLERLVGNALPRFSLRKSIFLLSNHLEIIVKESSEDLISKYCLFYKGHFVYGTVDYEESVTIYDYLYGTDGSLNKKTDEYKGKFYDSRTVQLDLREHIKKSKFGYMIKAEEADGMLIGYSKHADFRPVYRSYKDGVQYSLIAFSFEGFVILMMAPFKKKVTESEDTAETKVEENEETDAKEVPKPVEEWIEPKLTPQIYKTLHRNLKSLLTQSAPNFENQLSGYVNFHSSRKNLNVLIYNPHNFSFTRSPVQVYSLKDVEEGIAVKVQEKFWEFVGPQSTEGILANETNYVDTGSKKQYNIGEWTVGFDGDWACVEKSNGRIVVGYGNQKMNFENLEQELLSFKDKLKDILF